MKVSVVTSDGKSFDFHLSDSTAPADEYTLLTTLANSPNVRSVVLVGN